MTSRQSADPWSETLEDALTLYRSARRALSRAVALLERAPPDATGGKTCDAVLREHRRALQTVLDFEADLGKRSRAIAASAAELDLGAARAEIERRLALFRATGPDRGVPGGAQS